MSHFVVEADRRLASARILAAPWWTKEVWKRGATIASPPSHALECGLDPRFPGPLPPLLDEDVPIISFDLACVLRDVGVDNIEYFDAVVNEPWSGRRIESYTVFNVLGLVSGADMEASEFMVQLPDDAPMDVDFEKLVLDSSRIPSDLLIFRLAAAGCPIVVHAEIRRALGAARIEGLRFFEESEWWG